MTVNDYMALHYTIVLKLDDEGDWTCKILELKGCMAHADTVLKALRNLHEAQRMWIESMLDNGQVVPMPNGGYDTSSTTGTRSVTRNSDISYD